MSKIYEVPKGKTKARVDQAWGDMMDLGKEDIGYIDGYVQAADNRGYAVFIRLSDGWIEYAPLHCITAIN